LLPGLDGLLILAALEGLEAAADVNLG